MKCLSAAALVLFLATPALAQNAPGPASPAQPAPAATSHAPTAAQLGEKFLTGEAKGQWLANSMRDRSVYNAAGKPIGELKDVLIGPDGKVQAFVIGVGGFLGLGEKNVAVDYNYMMQNGSIGPDKITLRTNEQDLRSAPSFNRTAPAK